VACCFPVSQMFEVEEKDGVFSTLGDGWSNPSLDTRVASVGWCNPQ
jgi:hypothetical protein